MANQTVIEAKIRLPSVLATHIQEMAREREMGMDALLSELVLLGEMSLRHSPLSITDFMDRGEEINSYHLSNR